MSTPDLPSDIRDVDLVDVRPECPEVSRYGNDWNVDRVRKMSIFRPRPVPGHFLQLSITSPTNVLWTLQLYNYYLNWSPVNPPTNPSRVQSRDGRVGSLGSCDRLIGSLEWSLLRVTCFPVFRGHSTDPPRPRTEFSRWDHCK